MKNQAYYEDETTLVNFRVPNTIKETFDIVCRYNTTTRTKTLIDLMKLYIEDETPRMERLIDWNETSKKYSILSSMRR